jgi:hypothetical protein
MKRRIAFCVLMPVLILAGASADPLSDWFAGSEAAVRYEPIHPELSSILADAERRSIPAELLLMRIAEGAKKRVSPEKLLPALSLDVDNYAFALSIISKSTPGEPSPRDKVDLLARSGMALRSGMDAAVFERVLSRVAGSAAALRRGINALVAVAAVDSRMPLDGESKERLALSLASSKEDEGKYSLLSSLFVRGRTGRIGARDLVSIAVSVLDSGGGFLQLENEITRRLK